MTLIEFGITDADVEVGARAIVAQAGLGPWDELPERWRDEMRQDVFVAVTAILERPAPAA